MSADNNIGRESIEESVRETMLTIAEVLDEQFNGPAIRKRKVGFVLMVFPFDDFDGRCNYVSNARRDYIVTLLREQHAYFTGQPDDQEGRA